MRPSTGSQAKHADAANPFFKQAMSLAQRRCALKVASLRRAKQKPGLRPGFRVFQRAFF
jgi:hypothetical protein